MRNHDQKIKDMIESVLPSTARRTARRTRRRIHRRARARELVVLARLTRGSTEVLEDEGDFHEGRRRSTLLRMVLDRRDADNVGALTRWAAAIVEADPVLREAPRAAQVAHFAKLLPADLIGRHAVQHIEWALGSRASREEWSGRRAASAARAAKHRRALAVDLRAVIASGRHGEFNAALRRRYAELATPPLPPARYLLGLHDVHEFAFEAGRVPGVAELARAFARWGGAARPGSGLGGRARSL